MNKHLFIHGKPLEAESSDRSRFDGLEERLFSEFFSMSRPSDPECMLFEIRRWKGIMYSVYSYYHDGHDHGNRPNGYCVLTLIVEGFYSLSTPKVYKILSKAYSELIKGSFHWIDDSGRYQITTFSGLNKVSLIEDFVYGNLHENDFGAITEDITPEQWTKDKPASVNPCDADSEAFKAIIKRDGKVCLSEAYTPYQQLLAGMGTFDSLQKKLSLLNKENEALKEEKSRLLQELSAKKASPFKDPTTTRPTTESILLGEIRKIQQTLTGFHDKLLGGFPEGATKKILQRINPLLGISIVILFLIFWIIFILNNIDQKGQKQPEQQSVAGVENTNLEEGDTKVDELTELKLLALFQNARIDISDSTREINNINYKALSVLFKNENTEKGTNGYLFDLSRFGKWSFVFPSKEDSVVSIEATLFNGKTYIPKDTCGNLGKTFWIVFSCRNHKVLIRKK